LESDPHEMLETAFNSAFYTLLFRCKATATRT